MEKNFVGEKSIISIDEMKTILDNYRIGKKPLAKLLGWGETTIIRYIEGDIPTSEYSDKLRMILENPGYFYEILLRNQDKITNVAYRKSRKAVLKQLMVNKINVVAQYIINLHDGNIDLERLESLLYYVQGFSLAFHSIPIFEDEYIINEEVIPYIRLHEEYENRPIGVLELDENSLTEEEKELIEHVLVSFEWYGPKTLHEFMQDEIATMKISRDKENRKILSMDTIKNHFIELIASYRITCLEDMNNYPDQRFLEIKHFQH